MEKWINEVDSFKRLKGIVNDLSLKTPWAILKRMSKNIQQIAYDWKSHADLLVKMRGIPEEHSAFKTGVLKCNTFLTESSSTHRLSFIKLWTMRGLGIKKVEKH